jgi:hypothetical protein
MQKDDKKKKQAKVSLTSNTAKRVIRFPGSSEALFFEQRNSLIPNKELELEQVQTELADYSEYKDTSDITDIQTNQGEILKEVSKFLSENKDHRGIFEAVKTLFSKKDIKWTDQLAKIALRLVRLYELQRTGTTDVIGFSDAKTVLKKHETDLLVKAEDRLKAELVLKNVENSRAGTTEIGLIDLQQTRDMVQAALRNELVVDYQKPADPQKLEGPQGDMQVVNKDISPKVLDYLRLYESLSIAIIKQQEVTAEKALHLDMERERALASLDSLAQMPAIVVTAAMRNKFMDKISVMDLNQINYFCLKAEQLRLELKHNSIKPEQANLEISSWFDKAFTKEELHQDREQMHNANVKHDQEETANLIGKAA